MRPFAVHHLSQQKKKLCGYRRTSTGRLRPSMFHVPNIVFIQVIAQNMNGQIVVHRPYGVSNSQPQLLLGDILMSVWGARPFAVYHLSYKKKKHAKIYGVSNSQPQLLLGHVPMSGPVLLLLFSVAAISS